jgi:hydrogenase-1 operon protein HyaE
LFPAATTTLAEPNHVPKVCEIASGEMSMPSPVIRALAARAGLSFVDTTTIDAFLAPAAGAPAHAVLFFTGDPAQRAETADVAVVLPELLAAFAGRLRAAIVARDAEAALQSRFHVVVMPSLAITRGETPVGVLPRIRDWSDYIGTIGRCLAPDAPALVASERPEIRITHTGAAA